MRLRPLALAAFLSLPAFAQQLELPRPSLGAKVTQTVGLTDITVDYSSPAARGRAVFGAVVPYGEVWRTGANQGTRITFSKGVQIGGKAIAAGTYLLVTVPNQGTWTFIVNSNPNQWGINDYKQSEDLVRVEVKPEPAPPRERMTFLFSEATDDGVRLDLEWAGTRASLPIAVGTAAQVGAQLAELEKSGWRPWNQAAQYQLEKKDYAAAQRLVDTSLKLHEEWQNLWTKAQLLEAQGKSKDAHALAMRVQTLGAKDDGYARSPAAAAVQKALAEWK